MMLKKNMRIGGLLSIGVLFLCTSLEGVCQETVFMLFKNDLQLADDYYERKNFPDALALYSKVARKDAPPKTINLKIARCFYFLKQYDEAVKAYAKYEANKNPIPVKDIFYYAEAAAATGNYQQAIEQYRQYLEHQPGDPLIMKKIWRLNNFQFLLEDSAHVAIRPISLNTSYGELGAVPYRNGVVFMSNRNEIQVINQVNASLNQPYYRLYHAVTYKDSISEELQFKLPSELSKTLNSRFHVGPVVFYDNAKKMVFTTTSEEAGDDGERTLQLFFADEVAGDWQNIRPFPYNNNYYSISDPAISSDGKVLFFSSNKKGGYGGKDIYRSTFINNKWSEPENLGELINTPYDEVFPFFYRDRTLYFSSDGHAGLGGLDIFRVDMKGNNFNEVENVGYPLNSNYDDFGIVIDSMKLHGYLSSNRKTGGYDDNIYEFDMNLQVYPLKISGFIKYKEQNWEDSAELKILPNAKLELIDNLMKTSVYETVSDSTGNFSVVVPYFTQYKIKVTGEDIAEGIVSFEIPKQKKAHDTYEIVVVRDAFEGNDNPLSE